MPGILKFESNLSIILIIIIIVLVSIYFYLDLRKNKLIVENLEKKTDIIVKEIDNVHLQMHKFFNKMPENILSLNESSVSKTEKTSIKPNIPNTPVNPISEQPDKKPKPDDNKQSQGLSTKSQNSNDVAEISEYEFNSLKKQTSNNIFGMIDEIVNDDNNSILDGSNKGLPATTRVIDSTHIDDEVDDEVDDDSIGEINIDDISDGDDIDDEKSDKLKEYLNMSVKDLKQKCIEMNLKHSGNKSTLAKRIVQNL